MLSFSAIPIYTPKTCIDYLYDETMKRLYKYYRPNKFPDYTKQQLFLNPYSQVITIINTAKELLNNKRFINEFNRQNFLKVKSIKFEINRRINKPNLNTNKIKLMIDDIEFLYKFRDNFKLPSEENEIETFLNKDLVDLYNSQDLSSLHKTLNRLLGISSHDLSTISEVYYLHPEHLLWDEFHDRSERFYNNLLDFQMQLPEHVINMIKMYLCYNFSNIKIDCKKYDYVARNKFKLNRNYAINKITIREILDEVNYYFGPTIDIYNPYLKNFSLDVEEQKNFKFYVPIMDLISDYSVYKFENINL